MITSKKILNNIIILIAFIVFYGELDFRLRISKSKLEYDAHDFLYFMLSKNQRGFTWTHALSKRSPLISINSMHLRSEKEYDLNDGDRVRVLSLGSSGAIGFGLHDKDVWSNKLEILLNNRGIPADILNTSTPGWGPYYWDTFLKKEAINYNPKLLLILTSFSDLSMGRKSSEENRINYIKKEKLRRKLLKIDPFFTYSLRKLQEIVFRTKNKMYNFFGLKINNDSDVNLIEKTIIENRIYFDSIVAWSKNNNVPTVFLVRNAEGKKSGFMLENYLKSNYKEDDNIYTISLSPQDLDIGTDKALSYYNNYLIIPGDGHPNEKYNNLIAEKLFTFFISFKKIKD